MTRVGAFHFFIGACLAIVVFYIRRGLLETQSFKNAQQDKTQPQSSMFALFKHYPKQAFTVLFLTAGGTVAFYTYTTYLQKYLVNTSGFSKPEATQITTLVLFLFMCLQPFAGALSDRELVVNR